jgi:starvation-inducible DNA-binding protein
MTSADRQFPAPDAPPEPASVGPGVVRDLSAALNGLLADFFALHLKTKNFHWHVSGPHFRDYHLLFDDQAGQLFAATDVIAKRVRKIGGKTLRSIGHVARLQRILDSDSDGLCPAEMLPELLQDNLQLVARLRETRELCAEYGDVASANLLEIWIDEAERRAWFLLEAGQPDDA